MLARFLGRTSSPQRPEFRQTAEAWPSGARTLVLSLMTTTLLASCASEPKLLSDMAPQERIVALSAGPRQLVKEMGADGDELPLLAVGDLAECGPDQTLGTPALATSNSAQATPGLLVTLGDNVYPDGTLLDFRQCYANTWGWLKTRTLPSTGNHEYHTKNAAGYFEYFGGAAGYAPAGYYSVDYGKWHLIAINSSVDASAGSEQERWLKQDLESAKDRCILAYWHHPRFSSGFHQNNDNMKAIWQDLQDAGADLALAGHDHGYERFAPQTADGVADAEHGIREFVIGTGGATLGPFKTIQANSEVRNNQSFGFVLFTLKPTGYHWEFKHAFGHAFSDSGDGSCHHGHAS